MRISRSLVPNGITLLSVLLGFAAVTRTTRGDFLTAAWLLCFAGLLDTVDGRVAVMMRATSKLGGELDSFSDLAVSCFAPSFLMYQEFFSSWGIPGIVVGSLPLLCGALRLARFNLEDREAGSTAYVGLTTPIAAGTLVGFVILIGGTHGNQLESEIASGLTAMASFLMISTIRYDTDEPFRPPALLGKWRGYWLITFLPAAALFPRYAVFVWTTAFATYGAARTLFAALLLPSRGQVRPKEARTLAGFPPGPDGPRPLDS